MTEAKPLAIWAFSAYQPRAAGPPLSAKNHQRFVISPDSTMAQIRHNVAQNGRWDGKPRVYDRWKTHNLPSHEFMLAAIILLALAGVLVTFVY